MNNIDFPFAVGYCQKTNYALYIDQYMNFHANLTKTSVKPYNCTNLCTKTYECRRQFHTNCTMAEGGSLILLLSFDTVFLLLGCLVQPQYEDFHLSYCILFHLVWPMSVGYVLPFIWRLKKGNASGKEGRFCAELKGVKEGRRNWG